MLSMTVFSSSVSPLIRGASLFVFISAYMRNTCCFLCPLWYAMSATIRSLLGRKRWKETVRRRGIILNLFMSRFFLCTFVYVLLM